MHPPRRYNLPADAPRALDVAVGVGPPVALVDAVVSDGAVPDAAQWIPLRGGRTNTLWLVSGTDRQSVVKLYSRGAATPLFDNDPAAEVLVLTALSGQNIAPRARATGRTTAGPFLVYDHQAGAPWRDDPAVVARMLAALHLRPLSPELNRLRRAPDGSQALKEQTIDILGHIDAAEVSVLRDMEPDVTVEPLRRLHLLHGDPAPDNIVCARDHSETVSVLIDWQCPALGDPVLDVGLFLSPAMQIITRGAPLSLSERRQFLAAYDDPRMAARLEALQPLLHWRMACYCLWKLTRPVPDLTYAPAYDAEIAALSRIVG